MAKANVARRRGDDFQARHFWLALLGLRTSDYTETVTFECEDVSFVDDFVIAYTRPVLDPVDGQLISRDYKQCKYHMTAAGAFTLENLLDPDFIHATRSMLTRLYEAYRRLRADEDAGLFRLWIVSNWVWHPSDVLAAHVSEKAIRPSFFETGPKSEAGTARRRMAEHLAIGEAELKAFLERVRFDLGRDLSDLREMLDARLRLAGLKPTDPTQSGVLYDDLAWKLLEQGRTVFDRQKFDAMVRQEGLLLPVATEGSEISVCSCPQFARRPRDLQARHVDLTDLFDGRFPRTDRVWSKDVPDRLRELFSNGELERLPMPTRIFFDCHLSIAFLLGHMNSPKFGLQLVPVQKGGPAGYESWPEPAEAALADRESVWTVTRTGEVNDAAVIAISVSQPVTPHLDAYVRAAAIDLPRISFEPRRGIGQGAVTGPAHAWGLANEAAAVLRTTLSPTCRKLHVFMAVPTALAYLLGHRLRWIAPETQLYEHDFEGRHIPDRYSPSILIN